MALFTRDKKKPRNNPKASEIMVKYVMGLSRNGEFYSC